MSDEKKSIQLGFSNGFATTLKLSQAEVEKLVAAIESEKNWVEVKEEKRAVKLRADRIDLYSLDSEQDERRTGFE